MREPKPNFTPGPWHAATNEHYTCGGDMVEIVLLDNEDIVTDQIASVMLDTGDDSAQDKKRYQEQEANARLIAAAPDLYEALRLCLEIVRIQNGNLHEDINAIQLKGQNALAKAEGRAA